MESLITALVNGIVVPVITVLTAPIPFLASSGLLLIIFAALWLAFGIALVRDRARIDSSWRRLRSLPLVVQVVAWLLLLPVIAGLWVWHRSWPQAARLVLVAGLAGWNLLVLLPAA